MSVELKASELAMLLDGIDLGEHQTRQALSSLKQRRLDSALTKFSILRWLCQ